MSSSTTPESRGGGPGTTVTVGPWRYDCEREELHWSDDANRVHGLPVDRSMTLEDVLGLYDRADRSGLRSAMDRAQAQGTSFACDLAVEADDGRVVRVQGGPVFEGSSVVALYGTVEDRSNVATLERRVEVLRDASRQLMGAEDEAEVARIVADASKNILGYVNTTIRLLDADDDVLRTVISTEECVEKAGERPDYPVSEETPASRTYRTGESELHQDHTDTEDGRDRGELLSGLYVPIGEHGVMSAGDTAVAAFDENDVEAAELLGQLAAEALTRIESERELQAQNERLTAFIQNMTASIEEVTATTETVEGRASDAVTRATDGDEAIASIADRMDEIESRADHAAGEVEELDAVVGEIDEFVDLIDDIADQTNMLALNANIEAARAGEEGEGFAVVADEVKDLAERTGTATDEIETLLDNIEQHSRSATESIEETTEHASDGRRAARKTSELLGEVVEVVTETKDGVAEINDAMDEQARSLEDVAATLNE